MKLVQIFIETMQNLKTIECDKKNLEKITEDIRINRRMEDFQFIEILQ